MRKREMRQKMDRMWEREDSIFQSINKLHEMMGEAWSCSRCGDDYFFAGERPAGQKLTTLRSGCGPGGWPPGAAMVDPDKDGNTVLAQYVCRKCSGECDGWEAYKAKAGS